MNAGLNVSVTLLTYEPDLAAGTSVVADIYPTSGSGVALRSVVIPCGPSVAPRRFEVAPGSYLVSATLPSGSVLSEDVEAHEGEDTDVRLDATDSPHETHSWQYLLGNIESGPVYRRIATRPVSRQTRARDRAEIRYDEAEYLPSPPSPYPGGGGSGSEDEGLGRRTPVATWLGDSNSRDWAFESMLNLTNQSADAAVETILANGYIGIPLHPNQSDGTSLLYRFDEYGPAGVGSRDTSNRQLLLVETSPSSHLMRLPTRWGAAVEVLVNGRPSPIGSAVSITVRDPALGAGLAYMARGALQSAARLFTDVEEMLYMKITNPLAAAAGAYVLVGTDLSDEPQRWDPWLQNLRDWFGWMSDGSILWAVRKLRLAATQDDLEQARHALLEACDRGVPYFTLGLSWLLDGLADFPDDEECSRRREEVRRLCWSVDMSQPFVILTLGRQAIA